MPDSRLHYYPYGATRAGDPAALPTELNFTGQRLDMSTGLLYYGARYYDPALGRFISADTIVPEPGNPQALNRFSYVLNNPLRYTDPSGHQGEEPEKGTAEWYKWFFQDQGIELTGSMLNPDQLKWLHEIFVLFPSMNLRRIQITDLRMLGGYWPGAYDKDTGTVLLDPADIDKRAHAAGWSFERSFKHAVAHEFTHAAVAANPKMGKSYRDLIWSVGLQYAMDGTPYNPGGPTDYGATGGFEGKSEEDLAEAVALAVTEPEGLYRYGRYDVVYFGPICLGGPTRHPYFPWDSYDLGASRRAFVRAWFPGVAGRVPN